MNINFLEPLILIVIGAFLFFLFNRLTITLSKKHDEFQNHLSKQFIEFSQKQSEINHELRAMLSEKLSSHIQHFDQHQIKALTTLQESLRLGNKESREQLIATLKQNTSHINQQVEKLTTTVDNRLKEISQQVEKRLSEGFEKTTATFTDIVKRLALIDEAQKKITQLSSNVVSLQEILSDKRSRGAFGEVQLSSLIRNVLPEKHFSFQHTLSNGKRADCMLFLPEPTGNVAIDAKFPLESYRKLAELAPDDLARHPIEQQFRLDIKKHIQAIAEKYIVSNETADGAVMFIPAEAIFSEIHAKFPEIIEYAHRQRVWLVSPTTMMAILTTARAVLKDAATRKQIHIIQKHLTALAKDFMRFEKRMDNLKRHIHQANDDVTNVHISAKKITSRFAQIEQAEIETGVIETGVKSQN